jgi:dihydroorotase
VADLCCFDPSVQWQARPEALRSQGKHTPFAPSSTGFALPGQVRLTLVAGSVAFEAGAPLAAA